MRTAWIAAAITAAMPSAYAQTTIYKHVDEGGRVTYSNKPMKGATVLDLEPLTTIPAPPAGVLLQRAPAEEPKTEPKTAGKPEARAMEAKTELKPTAALLTPVSSNRPTLASVEPQLQRRRDEERRKILQQELAREEDSIGSARAALIQEQQNPALIAAVRVAQQAADPTPAQLAEMRNNLDKASGRIRGLQATVAEHEKNIEALKKELGAIKP